MILGLLGCSGTAGPKLDDSEEKFIAAQQALAAGDTEKATELLTASLEARPDPWAYYQRAKLYADAGKDAESRADCKAGLSVDPQNANLKWLDEEMAKPKGQRFKGKNAKPPSASK